jgi:hypothetical protein
MDDESVTIYVSAVIFNTLVLLGFFCCCVGTKKYRSKKYEAENDVVKLPRPPLYNEEEEDMTTLLYKVWKTTEQKILETDGVEGLLYLRQLKMITWLMNILAVVSVAVLIPIYYSGDQAATTMDQMTIGNIAGDEDFGYATVALLFFESILCYFVVYLMVKDI